MILYKHKFMQLEKIMAKRINKAIELLESKETVYYMGAHSGHVLTYEQGIIDAKTWADYINIGMEHGAFDMPGLDNYIRGLIDGGPTPSGHKTPAIIVEAPVEGSSENIIRYNAWQFRMILARGVHGIILCQAESPDAVRAFVESCRYPINTAGVGYGLDRGTRGVGGHPTASKVWDIDPENYILKCEPWPLNPDGDLLLGVKIESVRGVANCEQILTVPGIGYAEFGPGDGHMSYGIKRDPNKPLDPRIIEAGKRVKEACEKNGKFFLGGGTPDNINNKIDEGVHIISGGRQDTAEAGRKYTKRQMPV